ncbi:hypothetical protein D3C86_1596740 [compost metagenome]
MRTADQLARQQGLVAVTFGTHQLQIGFGRGDLRAHGLELQTHILRIQLGQRLILAHLVAHLDQTPGHLAADAEGQLGLQARAHLAGVGVHHFGRRLRLHHHGGADRLLDRLTITTGSEQNDEADGQDMAQHDR